MFYSQFKNVIESVYKIWIMGKMIPSINILRQYKKKAKLKEFNSGGQLQLSQITSNKESFVANRN